MRIENYIVQIGYLNLSQAGRQQTQQEDTRYTISSVFDAISVIPLNGEQFRDFGGTLSMDSPLHNLEWPSQQDHRFTQPKWRLAASRITAT